MTIIPKVLDAKLLCIILLSAFLLACSGGGPETTTESFGITLLPVLYNKTPDLSSGDSLTLETTFLPFHTPNGVSFLELSPQNISFAYPIIDDLERIKQMGNYVRIPIWRLVWENDIHILSIKTILEACSSLGLRTIVVLGDESRVSTAPSNMIGPTDHQWIETVWIPYVQSIVSFSASTVFAYEIWNEPWNPVGYMLGPSGKEISTKQYLEFLGATRHTIKSINPASKVINSGLTSIVESRYKPIVDDLIDLGIDVYSDYFNFHYYADSIRIEDEARLHQVNLALKNKVIISEFNHINAYTSDTHKFNLIRKISEKTTSIFNVEAMIVFVWDSGDATEDVLPWVIKDTPLEGMLIEWLN